ncbi:MAG: UDP-N-acetylglucosamine 2-epimerase (non-hydrolyzing) [Zetaproteobacteria bacterium CG12_big_fil_rev_8_21_14_0_65_55_1124]|nr:MAG: UDP-N-acetylglucosamine 2-epimerase [Zetaproteobacteria bacterium CG1_02_55_237]PIS18316.1 MAG: UDP-N-acetylglucosamine 2-epimerase (non-hydrolyzing) [Zetaproteobacteria bacterium CG08_land_8_20_14_0_20_55_17]PIW43091.1 MAG: UDP-N-acetylglucosamine 2-epimerase (non-hydrolyzing) [Zetaproteobacteria bacterium CG12_big_fil_rev_8_21_14_0_65_55_1124]PIY52256.1 MAG: UDP-N-acetylglucosamine 2-epimerase (non-hydrolyzing) [Zetaproteobacteria bacterium CG_4_10_14_0_8_um_filter_55_43]PIZ38747.1 MA
MKQLKVMTVVGTRPELIKLSRVISELDRCMEHVLVHTGQNYDDELNRVFFEDMEIRQPDYYLDAAGSTAVETIAQVLSKIDPVMAEEKPDALLLYGDTNSCMAAIAAKRHKIPIFHMEAGNRSFDDRVPEEINRRIIDHISDINMPLTEHARRYLIAEGIKPETIIKTGSCMQEVLEYYAQKIEKSDALERLGLKHRRYLLVSVHREENVDTPSRLTNVLESLNALAGIYDVPVIFSVHPRTRKRLDDLAHGNIDPRIKFMKAMGFLDYIQLQKQAMCVVSDSGTIAEEGSLLNLPAVTLRQAHERPEGMDEGTVIMSDVDPERVLQAVGMALAHFDATNPAIRQVVDYGGGRVSMKVVRIIQSYTDYIRRTVWREN